MTDPQAPRRFYLQRDVDITGVSGTGRVADGLPWPATRRPEHHDWPGTFDDLQLPEENRS